jgi:tetratricopeptide (TPR) repeat protein
LGAERERSILTANQISECRSRGFSRNPPKGSTPVGIFKCGQYNYDLLFLLILLLAFALRVHVLNDVGLNHDEDVVISKYLKLSLQDNFYSVSLVDHILPAILCHLSLEVLGPFLFSLRWHAAATSVLTIPVIYKFAGNLFDRRVALLSAFLLAVSPFQIVYAYEMRGYSGNIFFPFLALYCLYQALLTARRRWWLGFSLAAIAGVYMHLFALLMIGVAVLIALGWLGRQALMEMAGSDDFSSLRHERLKSLLRAGRSIFRVANMPRRGGTIEDENVTLSEAKGLVLRPEILRCAQNDKPIFRAGAAVRSQGKWLLVSSLGTILILTLLYLAAVTQALAGDGATAEMLGSNLKVEASLLNNYLEFSGAARTNEVQRSPLGERPVVFFAFTGLAVAGVLIGLARGEREQIIILLAWSLLPFLLLAMARWAIGWTLTRPHYLGSLLPPYLMLTTRGIIGLGDLAGQLSRGGSAWPGSLAAGALTVALASPNLALDADFFRQETLGNWVAVGQYLGTHVKMQDLILCQDYYNTWKPTDLVDTCARDTSYRVKNQTPLLYPVRTTSAVGYQAMASNLQAVSQPGSVWVALWGVTDRAGLDKAGEALQVSFDRYGTTGLLKTDDGPFLLDNLIQMFYILVDLAPDSAARFDYYLRLAELEAARGRREQAQAALAAALAIQPDDAQAEQRVAATRQALRLPPLLPGIAHAVEAKLGGHIELTGYSLDRPEAAPGDTVALTLSWQALAPVPADYSIFIHLRDAANRTVAQQDFQPFDGARPTGRWPAGQKMIETRRLALPADLPAGIYEFRIGMYDPNSMERLPVANDASGENAVILCSLEVR